MVTAKAEMLIRKPVAEVFEAFVDPAITSRFWFTRGSGRLEPGKQVAWEWEMYGVSAQVSDTSSWRVRKATRPISLSCSGAAGTRLSVLTSTR